MEVCANPCAQDVVSVGNTSTLIVAANPLRTFLVITNLSNELCSLGLGLAAVANKGVPLNPLPTTGPAITRRSAAPAVFKGAVYGITASGTKNVAYCEG
jgi:hypothetical protein